MRWISNKSVENTEEIPNNDIGGISKDVTEVSDKISKRIFSCHGCSSLFEENWTYYCINIKINPDDGEDVTDCYH